ncbi:unnamed protein product [Pedinophyceae sp. YPF-701]|nr:unnamed protein product [Pedinophyceae sp. YPF-701]
MAFRATSTRSRRARPRSRPALVLAALLGAAASCAAAPSSDVALVPDVNQCRASLAAFDFNDGVPKLLEDSLTACVDGPGPQCCSVVQLVFGRFSPVQGCFCHAEFARAAVASVGQPPFLAPLLTGIVSGCDVPVAGSDACESAPRAPSAAYRPISVDADVETATGSSALGPLLQVLPRAEAEGRLDVIAGREIDRATRAEALRRFEERQEPPEDPDGGEPDPATDAPRFDLPFLSSSGQPTFGGGSFASSALRTGRDVFDGVFLRLQSPGRPFGRSLRSLSPGPRRSLSQSFAGMNMANMASSEMAEMSSMQESAEPQDFDGRFGLFGVNADAPVRFGKWIRTQDAPGLVRWTAGRGDGDGAERWQPGSLLASREQGLLEKLERLKRRKQRALAPPREPAFEMPATVIEGPRGADMVVSGATCTDASPDPRFTCAQQAAWNKCGEDWMVSGGFCAASCGRCEGAATTTSPTRATPTGSCTTAYSFIANDPSFSILTAAVDAAGMTAALQDEGLTATVFAPPDSVFMEMSIVLKVPIEALLADTVLMEALIRYHTVTATSNGRALSSDDLANFGPGPLPTALNGEVLRVQSGSGGAVELVPSGGPVARVTVADTAACRVVVHQIDKVLVPSMTLAQQTP